MSNKITRKLIATAAAAACLPLAGVGTANADADVTFTIDRHGANAVALSGVYEVHVWGGAGSGTHPSTGDVVGGGPGGYVCWKGRLDGVVPIYVGPAGTFHGGGASTIVGSPLVDGDVKAIAGGGGGYAFHEGYESRWYPGGAGGTQTAQVSGTASFPGGVGAGTKGGKGDVPDEFGGKGGHAGAGGDRGTWAHGAEGNGVDGLGGHGGRGAFRSQAINGSGSAHGIGGTGVNVQYKGDATNAGGGGGGYGGGGGGGAGRWEKGWFTSRPVAGAGGGGGSYVADSDLSCTTSEIEAMAGMWDTRNGGGAIFKRIGS